MGLFNWLFGKKENNVQPAIEKEEELQVSKKLTDNDIRNLAAQFGLKFAHIKAIFVVEAGGKSGFLADSPDIPVTLEEGHIFYKYLKQKGMDADTITKNYPTICYPRWTKAYYKKGKAEYERYLLAARIDEECAMLATSWGMGQVMGFNYKAAGYSNVKQFVNSMYASEKDQLLAMCNFIKSNSKMYNALKAEDWAGFARLYNGPGYEANKYDQKLKKAFDMYKNVE